jgi:hypothetical protein
MPDHRDEGAGMSEYHNAREQHRNRLVVASAIVFMSTLIRAGTAHGTPPPGTANTCPADYQALTLPELLAQAERNGVSEQDARNAFEDVNKNEDAWICSKRMPSPLVNHYNFIDNQAVGNAKS